LLRVEDVSEENLEDVFKICASAYKISSPNSSEGLLHEKGVDVRRRWLIDMLEQHGPCAKIAYLDGRPVAQIVFCPEEAIPYIREPRKDVVDILCTYSPFPEAQRKGVARALVKDLVDECDSGLSCLGGRPCRFVVTLPFPREGRQSLIDFYEKYGFRQGFKEKFLEIKEGYVTRENPDYHPLPGDLDRTVLLYNPACEWGYFYAFKVEDLIRGMDPDHPIEIHNIWERPEEFTKRSIQRVTAGRVIVKGQNIIPSHFWYDREAFLRNVEEALRK
jgi:GNAT superfamily N-acetyltransferase